VPDPEVSSRLRAGPLIHEPAVESHPARFLAERLPECQRRLGHAPSLFIDNLPDEAIILSYVVCSKCKSMIADVESVDIKELMPGN
jgi:hypothetical protein